MAHRCVNNNTNEMPRLPHAHLTPTLKHSSNTNRGHKANGGWQRCTRVRHSPRRTGTTENQQSERNKQTHRPWKKKKEKEMPQRKEETVKTTRNTDNSRTHKGTQYEKQTRRCRHVQTSSRPVETNHAHLQQHNHTSDNCGRQDASHTDTKRLLTHRNTHASQRETARVRAREKAPTRKKKKKHRARMMETNSKQQKQEKLEGK